MDRHFAQPQLLRCQQPGVPAYDYALAIDNDRLPPTEFFDGRGNFINRPLGDLTAVSGVWNRLC